MASSRYSHRPDWLNRSRSAPARFMKEPYRLGWAAASSSSTFRCNEMASSKSSTVAILLRESDRKGWDAMTMPLPGPRGDLHTGIVPVAHGRGLDRLRCGAASSSSAYRFSEIASSRSSRRVVSAKTRL